MMAYGRSECKVKVGLEERAGALRGLPTPIEEGIDRQFS